MVNDLVEQAGRAQKIVRNLLDFARESEIKTERLDLAEVLRGRDEPRRQPDQAVRRQDRHRRAPEPAGDPRRRAVARARSSSTSCSTPLDAVGKGGHVTIAAGTAKEPGVACR